MEPVNFSQYFFLIAVGLTAFSLVARSSNQPLSQIVRYTFKKKNKKHAEYKKKTYRIPHT